MTVRTALAFVALLLAFSAPADDTKDKAHNEAAEALAQTLKDADTIFTAQMSKMNPLGQTNSIPASVFGEVTFKDGKAMKGTVADDGKYSYSHREGQTKNLDLGATGKVLVAAKGKSVTAIVPATEANIAAAKKAAEADKEKKDK